MEKRELEDVTAAYRRREIDYATYRKAHDRLAPKGSVPICLAIDDPVELAKAARIVRRALERKRDAERNGKL